MRKIAKYHLGHGWESKDTEIKKVFTEVLFTVNFKWETETNC